MRPNIICSLFTFGGSIVLAILATKIHDYETWFWAGAGTCFVAAIGIWAGPWMSAHVIAYLGHGKAPPPKEHQTESPLQRIGSPLRIEFGNDSNYERIEHFDETGIFRRMIYISVFNESVDDIQDCDIRLIAATPRPTTGGNPTQFPVSFGAIELRGKQRKFVQIVRFAENPGGNPSTLERDNLIILAASGFFFPGWTTIPIPSRDAPAIFNIGSFRT